MNPHCNWDDILGLNQPPIFYSDIIMTKSYKVCLLILIASVHGSYYIVGQTRGKGHSCTPCSLASHNCNSVHNLDHQFFSVWLLIVQKNFLTPLYLTCCECKQLQYGTWLQGIKEWPFLFRQLKSQIFTGRVMRRTMEVDLPSLVHKIIYLSR